MTEAERPGVKRSRFDQMEEPEPKRTSRFDRRSRSPPARCTEETRARSPRPQQDDSTESKKSPVDAAAAAAAAAARINAQLQARKGIQHVDVPPINKPEESTTPPASARTNVPSTGAAPTRRVDGEMYVADGDYVKDIEVNDLRNRYLLTKSSTQKMIGDETGAGMLSPSLNPPRRHIVDLSQDITTRGSYYPNKNMATAANPPLYLHITSTKKAGLEAAVAKIQELIEQELPPLVDERRFRRRDQEQPQVERDEFGRRKWPEEKIPVDLEPVPGFNLRAQIVGSGGSYVKHIQSETGCRVQIKGLGSGYLEVATNRESDEDMFLHVTQDLIANVKEQYEDWKTRPPRHHDRGGYGGDSYRGGRSHDNSSYSSYGRQGADQATAPGSSSASVANTAATTADWSQYAQYYASANANANANGAASDPYAAYGGYANYVAWYNYYYQTQVGQAAPGQAAPGQSAAPPPPPSEAAPPPPPTDAAPPPPGGGDYNSVPPPPGL
ncbi:Uncharacterized protein C30D11.14c [Tolypocladium ophioglossoides CBS 100239]|uniref:Uncharacterized protein C30D11.14c n=1 Tax=Tolypocladium ophioglossoides (strain CBS 100239) TaxID=1163406 RepID=A0A0L0NLH2_TOLOC|nr:Uncharacterized protein C30D11.14c [Tolypocladium ophioglossoides CBS 100239]